MSNVLEKTRGKLNLTPNENKNEDDAQSLISKDSNPKEDDDNEESDHEQDVKNLTSKLMNKELLN